MNNVPTFSVIVPIYKTEKYLRQCIESVLNQSCEDYELILVDDGSPDDSGKIADEYAEKSERVKVIHKANGGLVSARKTGTLEAKGRYILNLDSDDYMADDALLILSQHINKTNCDMYCFGYMECYEKGNITKGIYPSLPEGIYDDEESLNKIYKQVIYNKKRPFFDFGLTPSVWSKIVKREIYAKWQLEADEKVVIGEDLALTVPMVFDAESICVIHKKLYCYRIIESSLSHIHTEKKITNASAIVERFSKLQLPNDKDICFKDQLGAYSMAVVLAHLMSFLKVCKNAEEFKQQVKYIENSTLYTAARSYKQRFRPIMSGIITFLIKRKYWRVLWHIAGKRGKKI